MQKKNLAATIFLSIPVVVAVVAMLALWDFQGGAPPPSAVLSAVPDWAIQIGNGNAPITMIEFYDPLCPYCTAVHYRLGDEIERLVDEGRLRLVLIPVPIYGNESLAVINALQCAYGKSADVLRLLNDWYRALVKYAANKTSEQLDAVAAGLASYNCSQVLTASQIVSALKAFKDAGIAVEGTPTFVVVRDGRVHVILGARLDEIRAVLS